MFKKFIFLRRTYPVFLQELNKTWENKKNICLWMNDKEMLEISLALPNKIILLKKERNKPLSKKVINISDFNLLPYNDLKRYTLNFKESGSILDSQHIIEYIDGNLRSSISYYKFSREEVSTIYQSLIENREMFLNNPSPIIVDDKLNNKWID